MSILQKEYKLAVSNKMLSPKVSEQEFAGILKDENMRKQYWEYCNKKNPSFYANDFDVFSQKTIKMLNDSEAPMLKPVEQLKAEEPQENLVDKSAAQPIWALTDYPTTEIANVTNPSVAANPAPTNEAEYQANLAKQNEGEQEYNVVTPTAEEQSVQQVEEKSALENGMQIIDDAWDKAGFLGKVFLSPMKIADLGISLIQGAASGVVEWGGRGAMSLMAQAVENNKAGDYDTFRVDAMGNPMFVPKIGADGQYEKAGYSIEEQIAAAKRVEQAEAEGKEADIKDKNASMYVRAANKLEKVADKLYKAALPQDISEDATFIDLIHEGEVMDAIQLSVASTGQSIPYMLLNSVGGGGLMAATLSQANTYLDLSKEHPEMEKWKRYTYAIGSSGIEQAIEKFTNPFKGLKGASKKEISRTLKDITKSAEKAVWKRVAGNVLKESAKEGVEEAVTSVFTDIFGTMIDTDGEYGIGLIGQYNEYAEQMREQNPSLTDKQIIKTFAEQKGLEYAESFIMGALSGAYISTASSIATRDVARDEKRNNKIMLDAITATANENGVSREDVLGIVMKERDNADQQAEKTDQEKTVLKTFNANYAKATMKTVIEEQGDELTKKVTNKTNNYVFEVDFADGSLGENDMAYIIDGAVYTTDSNGETVIDRTTSDKVVYVRVLKEDGSEEVKQVAIDELNLIGTPIKSVDFAMQFQQEMYGTAEQLFDAQQELQDAPQEESVVGEDNATNLKAEGEQASNIEGRQFTNGQQTITASNPDSNGNVTLSSRITLPNGIVSDLVMSQQEFDDLMGGLVREEGWQEVNSQPTPQPQGQQSQAPVVWSEMDANQATATVVERSKGDKARAKKFAEAQVKVKQKALKDAQKELDKVAEAEDIDAFNAAQDKVDAIQAEVDKWTAVANGIDAYNAPIQVVPQPTPSATSASGNGVVTEGTARQSTSNTQQSANNSQNTLQNEKLSVTLQTEKSAAQKVIDKIDGGQYKTLVFNDENIEQQMRDAGLGEESIAEVLETIKIFGVGAIDGFYENGVVFVYENQSEDKVRSKYVHERQHGLNDEKGNRKRDVVNASAESQLKRVVRRMAGNDFYDRYNHLAVADEFICRAMEIAYSVDTDAELDAELRKYGANEQLIQIIKDLNNEQRKDTNLGKARKSAYVVESSNESSREGERDSEEISSRVLGHEGSRPSQISGSRDRSGRPSEVTQDTALEESGIQVNDETGDARFSVNYRLDANQMDILAEQIAERVGVSKAKAKKWIKAETSLAALCMQEDNVAALYYFADGRYGAIKNNSDYPQGTVDFNNICRKRLDFTNIYLSLQREFPNKVFTAKDLETIRQIMIEDGLEVACGLCYVEDRRQLLGEIANEFRGFLKDRTIPEDLSATKKEVMQKVLDMVGDDTYIPTIAQLLEAGAYELRNSHPNIFEAFVVFNNSRGMQSGRLFEGYAEYKREILDWSDKKVKQVNDAGGLRIFSFSDFEAHHLIDIVQIISDAASKGVMIQGYTKVPEFARAIRNTKVKLNRSLIPLGDTGIQEVDGKKVLAYDTTEGIDVNNENFLDESNNPNVGNVLVGINDEQIRMAMDDTNVDYIIPFHTGLKKDILLQKKIGAWVNYKNSQTEKDATTGSSKTADGKKVVGVNIYTDVLQAAEKEGTPIKNRKEFVEYFLKVCKERGLVPRFEQFLARGKNGEYKYTKGYEKLLVDFKMFDKRGNILPQEPVVPIFDDAFNQQIIEDYVKGTKETKEYESTKEKIKENLQLNESTDDLATSESQVRFSVVTDKELLNELEGGETIKVYRAMQLQDGKLYPPMSGKVDGEWRNPIELGVWEQADEVPDKAIARKGKDGKVKYVFKLDKGNKKSLYAAYNPYIHTSRTPLNDQFSEAQDRPELVTVEVEIPTSELTSGYKAEKAKDAVGELEWKAGVVQGQLTGTRKVILSRYDKPIRIVPDAEVAERIVEMIDGKDVVFPSNVVTPQLRKELEERGVQFKETDNQGKPRFSVTFASVNEELNADGISIDNDVLMKEYGLSSIELSKKDNYIKLGKIVVADKGKGNGSRFMQDLTKYADANGYTLTLTPDTSYGASSVARLKKFYKEFGFKDNKGRNTDYNVWESMLRTPKSTRFSITAAEDKAYADAVARGDMETAQRMVIEAAKKAMPNTKIVDADGNPMIVYHDTNATELVNIETGENWNDLDWRAKDEWRSREDFDEYWEERDFYTFNDKRSRRSIEMPAYFFSTKEDEYHEYGDRTIRAFLNITNPAIDPTIENAGTYDYAGEDAMNRLIEQGHDGFIRTMNNGEWDEVNAFFPNQIKSADPVTYDDNGNVIPLSERFNDDKKDIRFSLSNTNQRIFVSNAERAVESIKQEKATPQQWKAMIEKQGGLKAGEDKWLGLSEWLDSKVAPVQENETMGDAVRRVAKNTITKQEILDYIAEHQIQIEEVEYGNDGNSIEETPAFKEFQQEYEQIFNDMYRGGGIDGWRRASEDAMEEMMSRHGGEDFGMAFYGEGNQLQVGDEYAALHFIAINGSTPPINETRLDYTTEGLENKREIALTVPTIESWNENDEIHFGDAGGGRAIAWIRFGDTQMKTPREVVDHVDELQFAFTNVNGREVYAPQGSKFSKDYAVYGKLANGEMGYVLYVRDKQLSAHPTLEAALAALNAHYEANPRQVTEYSDVLVIDEIQSKRHQEGREKGYITKEGREIKKKIKELTDKQDAIYSTNRWSRTEDMLSSNEEAAEYRRLEEEIIKLQQELRSKTGIIPDAPFDKNWHELAFKRMLRYAAENGYDYVAWTTGEQQAERYNLGKQFDSIEREDNPSINGRRFALNGANYFTFVVNEEGVITESDMSEIQGKPLADVVGKDLAIRMMSLEDGDAIEGADLRIGGEGMKGFYDKMLPSFVAKYAKKWGAKVQDINLPSLEESAQTMHAVNVTQEMKDSVMEGQPMFSVTKRNENLQMSPESSTFAEQYRWGDTMFDEDYISKAYSKEMDAFYDAVLTIENPLNEAERNEAYIKKAKAVEEFLLKLNFSNKMYVISSFENMQDELENAGVAQDVIDLVIETEKELREVGKKSWGLKYNDQVFIFSEPMESLVEAQLTYAHELQHIENEKNKQLLADITNVTSPQELNDILLALGKSGYSHYLQEGADGFIGLADEVVAYMMEYGYSLGKDGNLAEALKRDGLQNVELINLLQQEYERRKEDSPFVLNKNQRSNSMRSNNGDGTSNDEADLRRRPIKVGEFKFGGFASRSMPQTKGELARRTVEQRDLQNLREEVANKLLSTSEVQFEDFVLEDDAFAPRFSITDAPAPTPTETKGEYLKRYMAYRESSIDMKARREFVQDMKDADKFFGKAAKKIVDRNKPIDDFQKAVVKQGGKLNVGNNAYADTTMAIGRAGYQVRRFADHQLKNMLDAIREMMDSKLLDNIVITWDNMDSEYTDPKNRINGKRLTVREIIGIYCQAMDVDEAKQKGLPDRGEAGFKKNLRDASGNEVTYEDVIRMVHDAVAGTNLTKKLWRAINNATKFALRYQLAAGMIDQETYDQYRDRDYYVPERGWRERDLDGREDKYNESQGMTNGSPYNAALQKAKGRDSLASDPFAYIQSIAETSILSAEKNKVKQKFLQFVFDNEEIGRKTGAWNIRKVWLVEGANGQPEVSFEKPADESKIIKGYATESQIQLASEVRQRTRAERLQHQVIVMKDGVQYIVELENEELANTLNGKFEGMNDLWEGWGNVQRSMVNFMSAINTQYNPVFPVFNLIRDLQLALISNIAEQDAKFTANFMKNIGKVQGAIWKYVANEKYRGKEAFLATTMGKYLEEYFEQGAQTGFSFLRDIEALNKDIDKALTEGKFKRGAKKTKDVVLGTLSMMTEWSELTVRMAQYVTARESGYSAEEAAQMAKEISVNFDRKGTESRALSKLYSFFNASIQGTNKIWRMLKHSRKANAVFWGTAALYMALGILNTLMNPDDPEEEIWASDYTRKTNFILFGKYRIPVAHFFRIFYGAGVEIVLVAQGRKTRDKAIFDTAKFTADELVPSSLFQVHNLWEYNEMMNEIEFNPAQYVQGAAPSWISPLTDVAINRNFMGGKINKEPYTKSEEGKYKAGKYAMKNTDKFWIDVADLLSGGDSSAVRDYGEGEGVSGSTLQHIFEGYLGQAGKFILDAGALPIKVHKGEEDITIKDIPFVNRLIIPYKQESAFNKEFWSLRNDIKHYEFLLGKWKNEDSEKYQDEINSDRYDAYQDIKWLVKDKPEEGDTHTPEDVKELMEANKVWRQYKTRYGYN